MNRLFTIEGVVVVGTRRSRAGIWRCSHFGWEAEGAAVQVLEPALAGFNRVVAGAGPVEVGQDVSGSALQGAAERDQLGELGGTPALLRR